jgi:signal transduction histidine kinase
MTSTSDADEAASLTQDRMIAAFARAASTIAWEGSLQVVLDKLAEEVLIASRANACAITLVSRFGNSVDLVGAAGYPAGYLDRANEALALGAPLISLQAYRSRVHITQNVVSTLESDARFEPYAEMVREAGWTTLVTVPLIVREERVGVLTALYTDEHEPSPADTSFLTAMADHGAIAVHTARLLAEAREKAALDERNRMARDVHDAISQSLFSIRLRTKALQMAAQSADATGGSMLSGLQALESIIDRAVDDMRALVMHLRPSDLRGNDLADAIKRYAEAISDRDAVFVEVRMSGELPTLPHDTEVQIYQIAREAIGNSIDHAKASRLGVTLDPRWQSGAGHLLLEVADDGVGFDPAHEHPGHLGLSNMRARAAEIDADLTIASSPAGTSVRLEVPMPH